jgi:Arc/MetJ-type ribon-helix-helix transcriptional regulator
MERVSLRVPIDALEEIDEMVEGGEYSSRSEAVRDAVAELFAETSESPGATEEDDPEEQDGTDGNEQPDQDADSDVLTEFENEDCARRIRRVRFGSPREASCPHCESEDTVKRGTTSKDAQRFWCQSCETYFNDLTGTVFSSHQLSLRELFYITYHRDSRDAAEIARELERDYESILNFIHKLDDTDGKIADVEFSRLVDPEIRAYHLTNDGLPGL